MTLRSVLSLHTHTHAHQNIYIKLIKVLSSISPLYYHNRMRLSIDKEHGFIFNLGAGQKKLKVPAVPIVLVWDSCLLPSQCLKVASYRGQKHGRGKKKLVHCVVRVSLSCDRFLTLLSRLASNLRSATHASAPQRLELQACACPQSQIEASFWMILFLFVYNHI